MRVSANPVIRRTKSVCPVCLTQISASLVQCGDTIYMKKTCPTHGAFSCPVWHGRVDLKAWRGDIAPLDPNETLFCPNCPGICEKHLRGSCCVLLEVTHRCNLRCRFCFANGGESEEEPSLDELKRSVDRIRILGKNPLLQLSGGEPTLRDDLPELIAYAKAGGTKYIQLNSNGLRLAEDEAYAKALAEAGLSFVFMQFDGTDNAVYEMLRGAPLLERKLQAIETCAKYNLGVTLVPTVVRGVNDRQLGEILRLAVSLSPKVRGVHFQPVSYFGRCPTPKEEDRYTLDELIAGLYEQAGELLPAGSLNHSRCDHPLCGLHAGYIVRPDGTLASPLRAGDSKPRAEVTAERNREFIGSRWLRPAESEPKSEEMHTLEGFLHRSRSHAFTVTAMAFQDAMNLDIERLRSCSLHVFDGEKLLPFCAHYLSPVMTQK